MSIGNIPKRIRRTYSLNAFPVIAYFPVLEGTPKETETMSFRKAKALLYHTCMSWVLRGLTQAGKRYNIRVRELQFVFDKILKYTQI
jgi:hypothetical protein